MKKIIALIIFLSITIVSSSQTVNQEKKVQQAIEEFFKGIHKGDLKLFEKTTHKGLKTQTTYTNNKGEKKLVTGSNEDLIKFVKSIKSTDDYFEKILSYTIHIDGNLASVWTPYEFYNKGKFSHCGVNSFQLFNNNGNWEIIYLIDTRKRNGCKAAVKPNK